MKSLRFTVYELLGYFAPGSVVFLAVFVFGWSAFFPSACIKIADVSFKKETWLFILGACYTLGHFIQGLCNFHPSGENMFEKDSKNQDLLRNARIALESRYKVPTSKYSCSKLVGLCQTLILHAGKIDDHDVFLYREGYYRGSSASFLLLALALIVRVAHPGAAVIVKDEKYVIAWNLWLCAILLSLALATVFYLRYRRFASYRVANLLNFACLPKNLLVSKSTKKEADGSDEDESKADGEEDSDEPKE